MIEALGFEMYFLNPIGHDHQPDVNRLGLTQEIGSAREEGTILLPGPAIVPILWNDFTKSEIQTSRKKS